MSDPLPMLVVTRPDPEGAGLMRHLHRLGRPAVHSPAFRLVARPAAELRSEFARLGDFDSVVVVSPFAARLVAAHAPGAVLSTTGFVTPGAGTARILEQAGCTAVHPDEGGTSEAILALPRFEHVEGDAIAIVGAPGGRRLLDEELSRRGARIERFDAYRRRPEPPADALLDALERGRALAVLVSSMNALSHLFESVPARLRARWTGSIFVVSSPRLARACRQHGADRVVEASGASDEAMLRALEGGQ